MNRYVRFFSARIKLIMLIFVTLMLFSLHAWANNFNLNGSTNSANFPNCSGTWTAQGDVRTCSGEITLGVGETIIPNETRVLIANAGFLLSGGNTLGSSDNPMSVQSDWGGFEVQGDNNAIYGNIQSNSGTINLNNTDLVGDIFLPNGVINISGGSVTGDTHSDCCNVTMTNTQINGDVSSTNNTVRINGGVINGNLSTNGGNGVIVENATMESGSITTFDVPITLENSLIGSVSNPVNLQSSNRINISKNSSVFGDVTAAGWENSLTIDTSSQVNGVCTPNHPRCGAASQLKPVVEYRFDECQWTGDPGDVIDSSGNDLNGTSQNGLENVREGRIWRGGFFDSAQRQFVRVPHHTSMEMRNTNQVTVSMWVKQTQTQNANWITMLSKSDRSYTMQLRNGRTPRFTIYDGGHKGVDANQDLVLNEWTHLLGTFDGDMVRLYVNGVLQGEESAGTISATSMDLAIGENLGSTNRHFHGYIDEVKVFAQGVNDSAALSIYDNERNGLNWDGTPRASANCNLIFEARFEEQEWDGTAGEVEDTSGSGFHGRREGDAQTALQGAAIPGNPGTCRYGNFDGTTAAVTMGNVNLPVTNEVTVMAWVRWGVNPSSGNRWSNIVTYNNSGDNGMFWLQHNQDNSRYEFAISTNEGRTHTNQSTPPLEGVWQHVTGVYDGTHLRLYVDGVMQQSRSRSGILVEDSANVLNIGRFQGWGDQRRFNGDIDEVRIFDKALSPDEIQQWMNTTAPCDATPQPDHLRIEHTGQALTCAPVDVTLRACANDVCDQLFTDEVTATLSPSGSWLRNGVSTDTVTFTGGTTNVQLHHRTVGNITLDGTVTVPGADEDTRCFNGATETCHVDVRGSGFLLTAPTLIAGKPTDVNPVDGALTIEAVIQDPNDPLSCAPAFEGTKDVDFWFDYENPTSGSQALNINSTELTTDSAGTTISVTFDANSQATLTSLQYNDAGRLRLHARYIGTGLEEGLVMGGQTLIVSRPLGLAVFATDDVQGCAAGDHTCSAFRRTGQEFGLTVRGVQWTHDNDDDLTDNPVAPNYQQSNLPLTVEVVSPVGGSTGELGEESFSITSGGQAEVMQTLSEVGVFRITATPPEDDYFDVTVPSGTSNPIGRFIPSHFDFHYQIDSACTSESEPYDPFSYTGLQSISNNQGAGQPFLIQGHVQARNLQNQPTHNYRDGFAKLTAEDLSGIPLRTPDGQSTGQFGHWNLILHNFTEGRADFSVDTDLRMASRPHDPVQIYPELSATDSDGVQGLSADEHAAQTFLSGRLIVGSEHSFLETEDIIIPFVSEFFDGQRWSKHTSNSCSSIQTIRLDNDQAQNQTGSITIATGITQHQTGPFDIHEGKFSLTLDAPGEGNSGFVDLTPLLSDQPWFQYHWKGNSAVLDDPTGRAAWGLFRGHPNIIRIREVWR